MRLAESRIRQIIREETRRVLLESSGGMSILPPDVPVDLYVEFFRKSHKPMPGWVEKFTPDNRERLVKLGLDSMLSQQEAEELADLGIMCMGPGEDFPVDINGAPEAIVEALGYNPARARKVMSGMINASIDHIGMHVGFSIFWTLSHGWASSRYDRAYSAPRGMQPDIEKLRKIKRSSVEEGIRLMDNIYEFIENVKDAPASTKKKLMKMIGPDGSGVVQMLEIHASLLERDGK